METKHTKGEWIYDEQNSVGDVIIWAKGTPKIAVLPLRDVSYNEQAANAKLISASPELLNACFTAKAMYEAQGINEDSRIGGEQYSQLLNAIKKATE